MSVTSISDLNVANDALLVAPSDSVDLTSVCRALIVGTVGDVKVTTAAGTDVVLKNVLGLIPLAVKRVWATGTTASNITGLV